MALKKARGNPTAGRGGRGDHTPTTIKYSYFRPATTSRCIFCIFKAARALRRSRGGASAAADWARRQRLVPWPAQEKPPRSWSLSLSLPRVRSVARSLLQLLLGPQAQGGFWGRGGAALTRSLHTLARPYAPFRPVDSRPPIFPHGDNPLLSAGCATSAAAGVVLRGTEKGREESGGSGGLGRASPAVAGASRTPQNSKATPPSQTVSRAQAATSP